jgi:hypothetical protein
VQPLRTVSGGLLQGFSRTLPTELASAQQDGGLARDGTGPDHKVMNPRPGGRAACSRGPVPGEWGDMPWSNLILRNACRRAGKHPGVRGP